MYVCVPTPGEVDSFDVHCLSLIAAATYQIWWKFANIFNCYSINIWLTFFGHSVVEKSLFYTLQGSTSRWFVGEVGTFIFSHCQEFFWGYCVPIFLILHNIVQKITREAKGTLLRHVIHCVRKKVTPVYIVITLANNVRF